MDIQPLPEVPSVTATSSDQELFQELVQIHIAINRLITLMETMEVRITALENP